MENSKSEQTFEINNELQEQETCVKDAFTQIEAQTQQNTNITNNLSQGQSNSKFCSSCKHPLNNEKFCPNCGTAINPIQLKKSKSKKPLIFFAVAIPIVLAAILVFLVIGGIIVTAVVTPIQNYNKGVTALENGEYAEAIEYFEKADDYKDSEKLKEKAQTEAVLESQKLQFSLAYSKCESSGTSISSDGLSITVDSEDKYDFEGIGDVLIIINSLGLPDSLFDEMTSTNALMGRQTAQHDYISISWSYHPDNGLDVIFKISE